VKHCATSALPGIGAGAADVLPFDHGDPLALFAKRPGQVPCLGSNFSAGGSAGSGGAHYRAAASVAASPWTGLTG